MGLPERSPAKGLNVNLCRPELSSVLAHRLPAKRRYTRQRQAPNCCLAFSLLLCLHVSSTQTHHRGDEKQDWQQHHHSCSAERQTNRYFYHLFPQKWIVFLFNIVFQMVRIYDGKWKNQRQDKKKPAWRDEDVEVRVMITDGRSKGLLHFSILEIKLEAQSWAMWKKNKEFRER